MSHEVRINELANTPHREGQVVLDCRREEDDTEIQIEYSRGRYWVTCTVTENDWRFNRLLSDTATAQEARDRAAKFWREGK